MTDDLPDLDRELTELGARWRADNPADFVPSTLGSDTRRSSSGWLTAGAAAAVAVAVILGATLLGRGGDHAATPSNPTSDVVNRLDCDGSSAAPVVGAPAVPDGVVAARMCGRAVHADGLDEVWPVDTLVGTGADQLADALNSLQPYAEPSSQTDLDCATTIPYTLVLRYADGHRVRVESAGSCERLTVLGGSSWTDATRVSDLALRLIGQQRAELGAANAPIPSTCPTRWQALGQTIGAGPVTTDTEVAVTACQYRLDGNALPNGLLRGDATGTLERQAVGLRPTDLVRTALAGTAASSCSSTGGLEPVQRVLIVRDGFGDIHVVPADRCRSSTLSGSALFPTPSLDTQLTALLARSTTVS